MELQRQSNNHVRAELGYRVRAVRKARGLNQNQLADRAGLSRQTISVFERGSDVSLDSFLSILRALDLLDALGIAVPEPSVSPMSELTGGRRQAPASGSVWSWGDETS